MKSMFRITTRTPNGTMVREYPMKEVQSIATRLGMDMETDTECAWFLKQALLTLLPKDWKRESDPKGRIKYHNVQTKATTATHPLLYQYRIAFFRLLQRNGNRLDRAEDDPPNSAQQLIFDALINEKKAGNPLRDAALADANEFYTSILGNCEKPPHFIEETAEYLQASPTEVLAMAHRLGMENDIRFFWVARMALVLPLPPCWEATFDSLGQTKYLNSEHAVVLDEHPAVQFLQKLVGRLHFQLTLSSQLMFFYDRQMQPYVVDLTELASGSEAFLQPAFAQGLTKPRRTLFRAERGMKDVIEDMMLLELTKAAMINLDTELHLVGTVYQFIQGLKAEALLEKWNFRYTIEGDRYWFHTPEERAYRHFPYAKSLRRFIKKKRNKVAEKLSGNLRTPSQRNPLFEKYGDELCYEASEEARLMMISLLKHILDTNEYVMPKEDIDVEDVFKRVPEPLAKSEVLSALFSCPFDLRGSVYIGKRREPSLNVSTDSEIFSEAGFKLVGDRLVFVLEEKQKPPRRGIIARKGLQAQILPRRRGDKNSTLRVSPSALLPFQLQVERVLRRMLTVKPIIRPPSATSSPSSETSSCEEDDLPTRRAPALSPSSSSSQSDIEPALTFVARATRGRKSGSFTITDRVTTREISEFKLQETKSRLDPATTSIDPLKAPAKARSPALLPAVQSTISALSPRAISRSKAEFSTESTVRSPNIREISKSVSKVSATGESGKTEQRLEGNPAGKQTSESLPWKAEALKLDLQGLELHRDLQKAGEATSAEAADCNSLLAVVGVATDAIRFAKTDNVSLKSPIESTRVNTPQLPSSDDEATEEEQEERRQLLDKVTEEVADMYLSALQDVALRNGRREKLILPLELMQGFAKLLRPIIIQASRTTQALSLSPRGGVSQFLRGDSRTTSPKGALPQQRLPPLNKADIRSQIHTQLSKESEGRRITSPQSVKTSPRNLDRNKRPSTHAAMAGDGLPGDFILSPSMATTPQQSQTVSAATPPAHVKARSLLHYLDTVGFPLALQSELRTFSAPSEVLPQHVIKMGKRLGLRVSSVKFSSLESDLLWIPLLQLSAPMPKQAFVPGPVTALTLLPIGKHPGDVFFKLMVSFNRKVRTLELSKLKSSDRVADVVRESWVTLSSVHNRCYLYNFLTGQKTNFLSMKRREDPPVTDERVDALKQYLEAGLAGTGKKQQKPPETLHATSMNLARLLK